MPILIITHPSTMPSMFSMLILVTRLALLPDSIKIPYNISAPLSIL